jgi:pilus assembly protein FimV
MKMIKNILLAVLMLGLGNTVFALGLGEIVLESGLNEPLKARVPLLKVGNLTEDQLRVQLASQEAFDARKMSRDFLYQSIHFTLDMKYAGGACILLTTEKPVKEPAMDFLIEASWPTGKLVRGYTVFLEKPKQ